MSTESDVEMAAAKNSGRRCFCNNPLSFELRPGANVKCWCQRCERRADIIPGVINVYGYGKDEDAALADWLERQRSM